MTDHTLQWHSSEIPTIKSYWIGEWHIEPLRLRISSRSGESTAVEPKMMLVLLRLMENNRMVVTREELLAEVWPNVIVSEASLSRCISRLRKIFRDAPGRGEIIETVRSRGYRLTIRPIEEPPRPPRLEARGQARHLSRPRPLISAKTVLGVGAFLVVFAMGWSSNSLLRSPLIVYRDAGTLEELGFSPDSVNAGLLLSSQIAFFTTGELLAKTR